MKKILFFLFINFILFIPSIVNAAECEIVMDADSGRVLYSKNIHKEMLIASTTKILTALVTINNSNLKKEVITGDEILSAYGSSIYAKVGEKYTIEELLYGLLLRSGNDASLILAKNVAGSIEGFVNLMNETAQTIGMEDSNFNNPSGLDNESENKSTVYDMALLMKEAMKNKIFVKVTSTKKYIGKTNFSDYEWYNKNELLTIYKYATGGKTGYTEKARHTFVSSASKDGKNLIIVTFVDGNRFQTHKNLYEKYFPLYKKYKIIDKENPSINYKTGYEVFTMSSFEVLLSENEKDKIKKDVTIYKNVNVSKHPSIIGKVTIRLDNEELKTLNLYAKKINQNTRKKPSILERIKEIFN